jgi:methyl acetate hydrolase
MRKLIENSLIDSINQELVPGVVAAVGSTTETTYLGAFGSAGPDSATKMRDDAIFRIASMTKAVTSVAIMQLVEARLIDLDAPASNYLPSLANVQMLGGYDKASGTPLLRSPKSQMTTRHLLTHTAGFGYEIWGDEIRSLVASGHVPSVMDDDTHYSKAPILFEPGTRWLYGINTDQLGLMVESVTGTRLDQYMREAIFEPLQMIDTEFAVPEAKLGRLVPVCIPNDNGGYLDAGYAQPDPDGFLSGGGGLVSTASDYLLFTRMLLNKGSLNGVQILNAESVAEMSRNQLGAITIEPLETGNTMLSADVDFHPGIRKSWGLGFLINEEPIPMGRAAGSLSWAGLFNSYFWIDHSNGITGVILMQVLPFFHQACLATYQRFEEAVYG